MPEPAPEVWVLPPVFAGALKGLGAGLSFLIGCGSRPAWARCSEGCQVGVAAGGRCSIFIARIRRFKSFCWMKRHGAGLTRPTAARPPACFAEAHDPLIARGRSRGGSNPPRLHALRGD